MRPVLACGIAAFVSLSALACGRDVPPPATPAARPAAGANADATPTATASTPPAAGSYDFAAYAYDCEGTRVVVLPGDDELRLRLPDREAVLPRVTAASGAKYERDDLGFWGKSINSATLTLDGSDRACLLDRQDTPWVDAAERGVAFRAVGHEPPWTLDILPERLELLRGTERVVAPNAGARRDPDQPEATWEATTGDHALAVTVEERACTDSQGETIHEATVTIVLDGETLRGCGQYLD